MGGTQITYAGKRIWVARGDAADGAGRGAEPRGREVGARGLEGAVVAEVPRAEAVLDAAFSTRPAESILIRRIPGRSAYNPECVVTAVDLWIPARLMASPREQVLMPLFGYMTGVLATPAALRPEDFTAEAFFQGSIAQQWLMVNGGGLRPLIGYVYAAAEELMGEEAQAVLRADASGARAFAQHGADCERLRTRCLTDHVLPAYVNWLAGGTVASIPVTAPGDLLRQLAVDAASFLGEIPAGRIDWLSTGVPLFHHDAEGSAMQMLLQACQSTWAEADTLGRSSIDPLAMCDALGVETARALVNPLARLHGMTADLAAQYPLSPPRYPSPYHALFAGFRTFDARLTAYLAAEPRLAEYWVAPQGSPRAEESTAVGALDWHDQNPTALRQSLASLTTIFPPDRVRLGRAIDVAAERGMGPARDPREVQQHILGPYRGRLAIARRSPSAAFCNWRLRLGIGTPAHAILDRAYFLATDRHLGQRGRG